MGKKVCTVLAVFISIIYFLVLQIVVLLNFASSFLNGETYANILKNEEFKTIKLSELNIEELTDDYGVDATVEDVLIDALVENGLKIEVAKEFVNNDLVIDLVSNLLEDYINYQIDGKIPSINRNEVVNILNDEEIKNIIDGKLTDEEILKMVDDINKAILNELK